MKKINSNGVTYNIKKYISLQAFIEAVNTACSLCSQEDGSYRVELKDFAYKYMVLANYIEGYDKSDLQDVYEDAYDRGVYNAVSKYADSDQLLALKNAIYEKVDFEIKTSNEKLVKDISNAIAELHKMSEYVSGIENVIGSEDMNGVVDMLKDVASGKLSVEEIFKARNS